MLKFNGLRLQRNIKSLSLQSFPEVRVVLKRIERCLELGKKVGMTSVYSADGRNVACTVIEAGPCVVTQVKNEKQMDTSCSAWLMESVREKNTPNALKGHFNKANTTPKENVVEFRDFREEFEGMVG